MPQDIVVELGRASGHAFAMDSLPEPLAYFVLLVSGWVNRKQQAIIDYLLEENRVLRAAEECVGHRGRCPLPPVADGLTRTRAGKCGMFVEIAQLDLDQAKTDCKRLIHLLHCC